MLGIIQRIVVGFKLVVSLMSLYCALVMPIIKYESVDWNLYTAGDFYQLKLIPTQVLHFRCVKLGIPPHDYSPVFNARNLETLSNNRHVSNLSFLRKLLGGNNDSPFFLQHTKFRVFTRQNHNLDLILVSPCTTNYIANEPLFRCMDLANNDPCFAMFST